MTYEELKKKCGEIEITYIYGWENKDQEEPGEEVGTVELEGKERPLVIGQHERGGFIIGWSCNLGFGMMTFEMKNGRFEVQTEAMSDMFVELVLESFRKQLVRVE